MIPGILQPRAAVLPRQGNPLARAMLRIGLDRAKPARDSVLGRDGETTLSTEPRNVVFECVPAASLRAAQRRGNPNFIAFGGKVGLLRCARNDGVALVIGGLRLALFRPTPSKEDLEQKFFAELFFKKATAFCLFPQ